MSKTGPARMYDSISDYEIWKARDVAMFVFFTFNWYTKNIEGLDEIVVCCLSYSLVVVHIKSLKFSINLILNSKLSCLAEGTLYANLQSEIFLYHLSFVSYFLACVRSIFWLINKSDIWLDSIYVHPWGSESKSLQSYFIIKFVHCRGTSMQSEFR